MKYFTKEYIKECDCEEIQRLKLELDYYDYVGEGNGWWNIQLIQAKGFYEGYNITAVKSGKRDELIWLPIGDQLDEEIEKKCKGKKRTYYFISDDKDYYAEVKQIYRVIYSKSSTNPYIAKIKLLKQLLRRNK